MKIELIIPNSLNEITLGQYQKYLKLGELTETELSYKMIEIFCGLKPEHIRLLKAKDVQDIVGIISQMFESKPSLLHTFKLGNTEYGFINNLDEMSFGEYIDLDTYIGDWDNIEKAMAVLYRPIELRKGSRYHIKEYEGGDADHLKDMPLDAVLGSILFFLSFRERIVSSYDELFNGTGRQELTRVSQFGNKWGWYSSVYALAQQDIRRFEDITKLKMHECLLFLTFEKEKNEIEASQIKNKFNARN